MQMRKKVDTPLVTLTMDGHWNADEDNTFTYTILENFESSTWDWIGLYKVRVRVTKRERLMDASNRLMDAQKHRKRQK